MCSGREGGLQSYKFVSGSPADKNNNKKGPLHMQRAFQYTSQKRFELPTYSLGNCCSILLSYWDNVIYYITFYPAGQ